MSFLTDVSAGKVCPVGKVMDPVALDCTCPSGKLDYKGQCLTACPTDWYPQNVKCYVLPPKNQGEGVIGPCCTRVLLLYGNPVSAASGNKHQGESIYRSSSSNGLDMTLHYNSYVGHTDLADMWTGAFGRNWSNRYDIRVTLQRQNRVSVKRPDGRELEYRPPASGSVYLTDGDTPERLERLVDGAYTIGWRYTTANGDEVELYDARGRLLSITSRLGLQTKLTYSNGSNGFLYPEGNPDPSTAGPEGFRAPVCQITHPVATVGPLLPAGYLLCTTDAFGRQVHFQYMNPATSRYDALARVRRMLDPAGGAYLFEYDGPSGPVEANNLTRITFADGTSRSYHYNEAASINNGAACTNRPSGLPNSLTGITDENGVRFATWSYDCEGRATSSEHALGVDRYTFSYGSGGTVAVDPLGTTRVLGVQKVLGVAKGTGATQPAGDGGGTVSDSLVYDANGNVISSVDFNGHRTNYTYDLSRNLETSRTEGLTAAGGPTPQTRTISTEWHASWRLPARIAEPLRITSFVYNGDGGATCGVKANGATPVHGVLCSKAAQATSDATGSQGFGAAPVGEPRTWHYVYNANGLVLAADGPRSDVADVTSTTYYADDDADLGKRGNVATITNAAGHTTSITAYNAHGQPTAIVDPNGLTTTLNYDARQRLTSRDVGGETTSYEYDGVGQLTKVTLPDGSFLAYTYDAAHRLTGMSDSLGNSIAYTLDAMGNRVKEDVTDPSGVLAQTRARVYDALNRLYREVGAAGQTTEYAYDNQGNVISVKDPLNRVTGNQYDVLNRLAQVTDPNLGVTGYGYNGLDALTSVTDPRGLVTGYAVDGLGNLNQQSSPDTGITTNTYDAAGNLVRQTDAKGQTTVYAYDALNRVTSITFPDGSTQTYAYDQGTNGLGRLSGITESDPAAQVTSRIAYSYDPHGRVVSESRMVAGQVYTVTYSYDPAGRLAGMIYPSGRSMAYAFDGAGRIAEVTTTQDQKSQVLVQQVQHHPFGGVKSYVLGNGQLVTRTIDLDGRIAGYTLGNESYDISFDAASRITGISQLGNTANTNSYGYDELDRLTSAGLAGTRYGYTYDPVGNRLTKNTGNLTDVYAYSPTSNRIASLTSAAGAARSFMFDANGSTMADGVNSYVYDVRGRMSGAASPTGLTFYQVNALGQRVRKTSFQGDTVFHYDLRGHLIAETDTQGEVKRELMYLGDIPVAVFQ